MRFMGSIDIHPDGDRFAAAGVVAGSAADPDTSAPRTLVVTNWFTELLERLGEGG
jgi:hypothetical protein